jgi:hypothetical protein
MSRPPSGGRAGRGRHQAPGCIFMRAARRARRSHGNEKDPAYRERAGFGRILMNAPERRRDENSIDSRAADEDPNAQKRFPEQAWRCPQHRSRNGAAKAAGEARHSATDYL